MRSGAAAALCLLLLTGASAQRWGPNGNGTLDHADDLQWVFFHDAKITADETRGVYTARFSPSLLRMEGKPFAITGYMMPVETNMASTHFILTRRSTGCPFCPPNEPTEAMEINTTRPVAYTQAPVTVVGKLHLVASSDAGLFYRLDDASAG